MVKKWYNVLAKETSNMDEELEKMCKREEIKNQIYSWGMVVLFAVVFGLLARMFISAL
jgi:hypothetical protein